MLCKLPVASSDDIKKRMALLFRCKRLVTLTENTVKDMSNSARLAGLLVTWLHINSPYSYHSLYEYSMKSSSFTGIVSFANFSLCFITISLVRNISLL